MTTWEPVTPVIDAPEPFTVGDRVRVRLNGECQQEFSFAIDSPESTDIVPYRHGTQYGHHDSEHQRTGYVNADIRERFADRDLSNVNAHFYCVWFDEPLPEGDAGATYAASELELLW